MNDWVGFDATYLFFLVIIPAKHGWHFPYSIVGFSWMIFAITVFFHEWSSSCLILYEWFVSYFVQLRNSESCSKLLLANDWVDFNVVVLYFGCCYPAKRFLPSQGQNFHPNVCLVLARWCMFFTALHCSRHQQLSIDVFLFLPMLFRASWWVYPRIVSFSVDAFALHAVRSVR